MNDYHFYKKTLHISLTLIVHIYCLAGGKVSGIIEDLFLLKVKMREIDRRT
jgi:hypothetical protein